MFIELTPIKTTDAPIDAVTVNFYDVRSFYYDENLKCTILRFFDETRTNFKVKEPKEFIQAALAHLNAFYSAKDMSDSGTINLSKAG